jgi:hypothetical protein
MTTIKIKILKDNSWDSEGDALQEAEFTWQTDGSQQTQERIASDIAKALRVFSRTPLKAVSFSEIFLNGEPTKEQVQELKEERGRLQSEQLEQNRRIHRVLTSIGDEEMRRKIEKTIWPLQEDMPDATKIKYE